MEKAPGGARRRPEPSPGTCMYQKSTIELSFFTRCVCCSSSLWNLGMSEEHEHLPDPVVVVKRLPKLELPDGNHDAVRPYFQQRQGRGGGQRLHRPCTASYLCFPSRSSPETRSSATEVRGRPAPLTTSSSSSRLAERVGSHLRHLCGAACRRRKLKSPLAPEDHRRPSTRC